MKQFYLIGGTMKVGKTTVGQLLKRMLPLYGTLRTVKIDTTEKTAVQVAAEMKNL